MWAFQESTVCLIYKFIYAGACEAILVYIKLYVPNKAAYMSSLHTLRCAVKQGLSRFATLHAVLCRDALHGACFCEVHCRTPKAKQFLGEPLPCPMRLVSYRSSHAASQPVLEGRAASPAERRGLFARALSLRLALLAATQRRPRQQAFAADGCWVEAIVKPNPDARQRDRSP